MENQTLGDPSQLMKRCNKATLPFMAAFHCRQLALLWGHCFAGGTNDADVLMVAWLGWWNVNCEVRGRLQTSVPILLQTNHNRKGLGTCLGQHPWQTFEWNMQNRPTSFNIVNVVLSYCMSHVEKLKNRKHLENNLCFQSPSWVLEQCL